MPEFYVPTFRNVLFHIHRYFSHDLWRMNTQNVTKRRNIKFRRQGITQEKEYNINKLCPCVARLFYILRW
jgi:hypothetical protein